MSTGIKHRGGYITPPPHNGRDVTSPHTSDKCYFCTFTISSQTKDESKILLVQMKEELTELLLFEKDFFLNSSEPDVRLIISSDISRQLKKKIIRHSAYYDMSLKLG